MMNSLLWNGGKEWATPKELNEWLILLGVSWKKRKKQNISKTNALNQNSLAIIRMQTKNLDPNSNLENNSDIFYGHDGDGLKIIAYSLEFAAAKLDFRFHSMVFGTQHSYNFPF